MVQAEGLEAVFECLVPGAVSHTWGFNGVFLAADQFSSNVTRIAAFEGSLARLIIPATPQYNNTVVQCRAIVDEGGGSFRSVLSNNATLRVQGEDTIHVNLLCSYIVLVMFIYVAFKVLFLMYPTSTFCLSYHQTPPSPSPGTLPSP